MPLRGEAAAAASLMGVSSPSSAGPCHVRTPLARPRLLTTVHEELDITRLDLIIPGVVSLPLRGDAQVSRCPVELALPSHPGQLRSQPNPGSDCGRSRVLSCGPSASGLDRRPVCSVCVANVCGEAGYLFPIPLPRLLPNSWRAHSVVVGPPNLDAECQCHAKHHDVLYLHRCSESRVFQIRAKKESSWSPKLCTESKV